MSGVQAGVFGGVVGVCEAVAGQDSADGGGGDVEVDVAVAG